MVWPLPAHFSLSLQNPRSGLKDPKLQEVTVERNRLGQPRPWSGAFAVVFKGTDPAGKSTALRAFTSEVPGQRERYRAIGDYLSSKRLKCLVNFHFTEEGIRSGGDGQWYPLLTMDWVDGLTLFDWTRERALAHDGAAFAKTAVRWVELVNELAVAGIAHGDLQHANVMVTPAGELKLVDYDCMGVPALFGQRNTEIGVHPYQHPDRGGKTVLAPHLDRFSAIFILIALKALAADPTLWERYILRPGDADEYDKLLIRGEDLEQPGQSPLMAELFRSKDSDIRALLETLLAARTQPLDKVPPLGEALASFAKLESLLKARSWDDAVELGARFPAAQMAKAPPAVVRAFQDARNRVDSRQKLEAALADGDEAAAAKLYQPRLLDDYPAAAAAVRLAKQSAAVAAVLTKLDAALAANQGRAAVALWEANVTLWNGRASAAQRRPAIEQWKARNRACDELLAIANKPGTDPAALTRAWRQLEETGGHPDAAAVRAGVQHTVDQHAAWEAFRLVPRESSAEADRQLDRAWKEPLFGHWPPAEAERPRVDAARQRLRQLVQWPTLDPPGAAPTERGEKQIVEFVARLPAQYAAELTARAVVASDRLEALGELRTALRAANPSDRAIAEAWATLSDVGGAALVTGADRQRAELAGRRRPMLDKLSALPTPIDERDIELLKAWKPDLEACPDAAPWKAERAAAARRFGLLRKIRAALTERDDLTAHRLLSNKMLKNYPLPTGWHERVTLVREAAGEAAGVFAALQNRDYDAFGKAFNAGTIRRYAKEFAPYQNLIVLWAEQIAATPAAAPKELTFERPGLMAGRALNTYEARWTWPERRYTDRCRVAVCTAPPSEADKNRRVFTELIVLHGEYEQGLGQLTLTAEPAWAGACVVVWSFIDVGFAQVLSRPHLLGRIAAGGKRAKG